jgi:transcriptional regulator with XRE-family HTH domain/Zn-dependent peptidase ImmA (M78 family)
MVLKSMEEDLKFIGKNIRFFRRSKNWTLLQLASKIGIQEGPLGRIERGLNLPSTAVLYKLTNVLGISVDALFASEMSPRQTGLIGDVCFITIDPYLEPPPKKLLSACHEIMTSFHALEDICGVQKHAYLPLSIPFDPDYQGMEELALRVRNSLGTGDAVLFDYFELFENFGLRIILFPFMNPARDLDALSFYEPAFHNAFFFLNSKKNLEKQLFSLSLELGKILIFNQICIRKDRLFVPTEETLDGTRPINETRAAKRFAATFLMPKKAVQTTVGQLGITPSNWSWEMLLRIKQRFGISAESFLYRLKELGLLSDELCEEFKIRITQYYGINGFMEPAISRRSLNSNGRFFDLLLMAENVKSAEKEVSDIKRMVDAYKIVTAQ